MEREEDILLDLPIFKVDIILLKYIIIDGPINSLWDIAY
jgi:hypothetical protein